MKRRDFVAGLGVGLVGSVLSGCGRADQNQVGAAGDVVQPKVRWKLVTAWPKGYPGLGMAPERLSKLVAGMTNDAFQIKVYGAGELVPALEVFDGVSGGTAEMGHSGAYYWKGKSPAFQFFTAVPFGLTAQEMNGWLFYGGGLELWQELAAKFNIHPLPGGSTGVQMAGWFNKEINSMADLKGLKMRIPGLGGEVLKRAGGIPVMLSGGELFTSLQSGAIDATEWVGPYNDRALGLHQAAKYYYYPGWHEPGAMLEFIMNKQAFEALPAHYQHILTVACRAINQDMLDEYTARNNQSLQQLIKDGVQLRRFPDSVLKKLRKLSDKVVAEVAESDPFTKKVYESYLSFREDVMQYHAISEQAYINARSL